MTPPRINVGVGGPMHHGHGHAHHGYGFYGPVYEEPLYCPPPGYPQPVNCIPYTSVAGAVSDLLPKTAVDVMQLQSKYDSDFDALNDTLASCAQDRILHSTSDQWIDPQLLGDWEKFYLTWKSYVSDPNKAGITGIADDNYLLGIRMVQELNGWRDLITHAGCIVSLPPIVPPPDPTKPGFAFTWPMAALAGVAVVGLALLLRH